jgi:hypothetical protein
MRTEAERTAQWLLYLAVLILGLGLAMAVFEAQWRGIWV